MEPGAIRRTDADRYEALLIRAILDIADEPNRAGSQQRPEIADRARTYHLRHSRDRVEATRRVNRPRHFLLYRLRPNGQIEIGRVLHESMVRRIERTRLQKPHGLLRGNSLRIGG